MKKLFIHFAVSAAALVLTAEDVNVNLTPQAIPGTPRSSNTKDSGGYAPSNVQTQLKLEVKDNTKTVRFVRDTNNPFVVSKAYVLKNANPYAVRDYLRIAVLAKQMTNSESEVDSILYNDGTGIVIVSAEDYRFNDIRHGESIDQLITKLDKPGMSFSSGRPKFIYYPRANVAANLLNMVNNVGSVNNDIEFTYGTDALTIDGELNAIVMAAPFWSMKSIKEMLAEYDKPIPEVKISYKVVEIYLENDDKIGTDFQSWKNNEGADFFSAGGRYRSNWASTFAGGMNTSGSSKTEFYNFNPKWNSKYIDFLATSGKAKTLASGVVVAKNRRKSKIEVSSGLFYADVSKNIPPETLNGIIPEDKTKLPAAVGDNFIIQHGKIENTEIKNGFIFNLYITPVVTQKSAILDLNLNGISLLGWTSSGTPRVSNSSYQTTVQIGYDSTEFVIGGIKKSEMVRSSSGLPFFKDLPGLGWLFSTESESTKQSQLVLIATAQYSQPTDQLDPVITLNVGKITDEVEKGIKSPTNNLGFEQYYLDPYRKEEFPLALPPAQADAQPAPDAPAPAAQ